MRYHELPADNVSWNSLALSEELNAAIVIVSVVGEDDFKSYTILEDPPDGDLVIYMFRYIITYNINF